MIASEEVAKTILVTGGSGFLGKHVVSRLATDGFRIVSVDRRPISGEGHPSVSYILGDLQDAQLRAECFAKPLEAVVHLAASTSVIRSAESPAEFFENNVMVTQELLELCRINKVKGFVFASSAATTEEVGALPITPEFPVRPISPYAATKSACEALINAYGNSFAMNTANIRFTNIYGPGLAEKDSLNSRLMKGALEGRGIEIYGDGSTSRDYIYVEDAVDALVLGLGVTNPTTFIAGSGRSSSILETIATVSEITGITPDLTFAEESPLQMSHVVIDPLPAEKVGFRAKWSFGDGLRETWKSFAG